MRARAVDALGHGIRVSVVGADPVAERIGAPSPSADADADAGRTSRFPPRASRSTRRRCSRRSPRQAPPLNDPGVTMLSTQNAELLEILHSGLPTIRCSWGAPSEFGLATNVSIVDGAQSAAIATALRDAGFGCEQQLGGTICRTDQTVISQDDTEVRLGETHFLRGNGWVSTAWINFAPTGYTEDIVGDALGLIRPGAARLGPGCPEFDAAAR